MPRTPFRLLACFVLVLAASAQLGALVHLAVVPHVRCEAHGAIEHGDVEHDAHGAHGAQAGHAHADVDESAARGSAVTGGESEHGHELCETLAMRDERALGLAAAPVALARPPLLSASIEHAPAAPRLASRALDHAPKTSPPA